jgi:hypothetical protein
MIYSHIQQIKIGSDLQFYGIIDPKETELAVFRIEYLRECEIILYATV